MACGRPRPGVTVFSVLLSRKGELELQTRAVTHKPGIPAGQKDVFSISSAILYLKLEPG